MCMGFRFRVGCVLRVAGEDKKEKAWRLECLDLKKKLHAAIQQAERRDKEVAQKKQKEVPHPLPPCGGVSICFVRR